jgi:hypothetical protein
MIQVNLFTSYYTDRNEERNKEIISCIENNLKCKIESFTILYDNNIDKNNLHSRIGFPKIEEVVVGGKPSFNDFFALSKDGINIFTNSDIYITDEEVSKIKIFIEHLSNKEKTCLALSRWDVHHDGSSTHFDRADSQDTWIFFGKIDFRTKYEFGMGVAGCDNVLAHQLNEYGYRVLNPSKQLKTFHLHLSGVRNYLDNAGRVFFRLEPPYYLVKPY